MRGRFQAWRYRVQESLWFIPTILTAAATALALLMVWIDRELLPRARVDNDWLFGAGASGAREVLSAIAATTITVAGVVFSITIVALQLASSQFSPRVLRNFTGDRGNQFVLGVFIATFAYTLLVLRTLREAADDRGEPFVPSASVTLAIVLALVCIGFLIYYISHAATSIRAEVIIDRAAGDTLGLIDTLFPDELGRSADPPTTEPLSPGPPGRVTADRAGYLQSIDSESIFRLAGGGEDDVSPALTVRISPRIGAFVLTGALLAEVWPMSALDDRREEAIRRALILGSERTLQSDLELGLQQLADIALKALSPGINDPTTARICIDRLAAALVTLAGRQRPAVARTGDGGRVRVIVTTPSFDQLVSVAFAQIRHYGAGDAAVMIHLIATLGNAAALVTPLHQESLAAECRQALHAARQAIIVPADRERVEAAAVWTVVGNSGAWPHTI